MFFSDMRQLKCLISELMQDKNQELIEKELEYNKQRNFLIEKLRRDEEKIIGLERDKANLEHALNQEQSMNV